MAVGSASASPVNPPLPITETINTPPRLPTGFLFACDHKPCFSATDFFFHGCFQITRTAPIVRRISPGASKHSRATKIRSSRNPSFVKLVLVRKFQRNNRTNHAATSIHRFTSHLSRNYCVTLTSKGCVRSASIKWKVLSIETSVLLVALSCSQFKHRKTVMANKRICVSDTCNLPMPSVSLSSIGI